MVVLGAVGNAQKALATRVGMQCGGTKNFHFKNAEECEVLELNEHQAWSSCHDGKLDSGDTAFMIFATTMVMMQTPATGIAQAGMIRQKNTLSMLN